VLAGEPSSRRLASRARTRLEQSLNAAPAAPTASLRAGRGRRGRPAGSRPSGLQATVGPRWGLGAAPEGALGGGRHRCPQGAVEIRVQLRALLLDAQDLPRGGPANLRDGLGGHLCRECVWGRSARHSMQRGGNARDPPPRRLVAPLGASRVVLAAPPCTTHVFRGRPNWCSRHRIIRCRRRTPPGGLVPSYCSFAL